MRTVTAIMALAIVFLLVSDDSVATTYTATNQSELGDAFRSVADGDTVLVGPGYYLTAPILESCITVRGMTGNPEDVVLEIWEYFAAPIASAAGNPVRLEGVTFYGGNCFLPLISGSNLAIEIRNCIIYGFAPEWSGGAIRADNTVILLENTVFERNIGPDDSGGAFHLTDCEITARDCAFTRNMSNISGGVFYMAGGSVDLTGCTFQPNYGIEGGGALDLVGVSGTIAACSFTENESGSLGTAALKLTDCQDLTLTDSTISNNLSSNGRYGGMMILGSSDVTLEDCVVLNNQADPPADGYLAAESSVIFRCCELDPTQWLFEGTVVIDNEGCPVATENHSFGSVKAIFR